ncbi:DNA primase [Poriferisphaera corsica]|uniref:DNA primase n=2 Tax=Poriferisphaera corsica TaxID=2528020 RepID=A0A517YW56_9BACT|nr:DNA primase [Poriferisphaera corsica]
MVIREDQKLEVQAATDIVRLIGEQVQLRPKGREFACLCPFHEDKNPSMFVSPQKQIYKCFSCGAGGDVFTFVMNYHKMSFPEALEHLAERAGIELTREKMTKQQMEAKGERQLIGEANEIAVKFFRAMYGHERHGAVGREYVGKREISDEMMEVFGVGVSVDAWDGLAQVIAKRGWDVRGFELAGLVGRRQDGSLYDRMRHRLIFPIFDAIGRPIAFGGRKLREEDEPKYLNSPETKLFNKSRTLYGLHAAKKPIIDSRTAVIVEGYTDVIACHQAGAKNVVATLGTALTREHAGELRRYAEKVVLIFDADEAGQKAADRAAEVFLTGEIDVAIAVLPNGHDPDSLMKEEGGREKWDGFVTGAEDALSFLFSRLKEQMAGNDTVTGRERIAEGFIDRMVQMGLGKTGAIRRALVIRQMAGLLGMSEEAVGQLISAKAARVEQYRRPRGEEMGGLNGGESAYAGEGSGVGEYTEKRVGNQVAGREMGHKLKSVREAERQVMGCLIREHGLFHESVQMGDEQAGIYEVVFDEAILPAEMEEQQHRMLYQEIYDRLSEGQELSVTSLIADLASGGREDLVRLVTEIEMELDRYGIGDGDEVREMFHEAVKKIVSRRREKEYEEQRRHLQAEGRAGSQTEEDKLRLMNALVENRRMNPSPVRIARVRRD